MREGALKTEPAAAIVDRQRSARGDTVPLLGIVRREITLDDDTTLLVTQMQFILIIRALEEGKKALRICIGTTPHQIDFRRVKSIAIWRELPPGSLDA